MTIPSPFSAVVAPAILTNACSVLALGTGNRVARVVDRTRVITNELGTIVKGTPIYENRLANIQRLRKRARLLLMLSGSSTLRSEVSQPARSSRLSELSPPSNGYGPIQIAALAALATGLSAVVGLVSGCAVMVAETRLALLSVDEALEDALSGRPT